jgi:hypothetical protein
MMIRTIWLVIASLFFINGECLAADVGTDSAAVASAEKWLLVVDGGKFSESWNQASESFRNRMTQAQCEQLLQIIRQPVGTVLSRKINSTKHITSPEGLPGGEYVHAEFETSFENKKSAIEVVILTMDKDAAWRVDSYYIKN